MKFIIYQDNHYQWRWMVKDMSGNIRAAARYGFASRQEAVDDAERYGYRGY